MRANENRRTKFREWLRALLQRGRAGAGPSHAGASSSAIGADNDHEPASISSPRVLLVILNPFIGPTGARGLAEAMGWAKPDDLVQRFISEILQASGGLVRYRVVERVELREFPRLSDGYRYDAAALQAVLDRAAEPHSPSGIDYLALLQQLDAMRKIEQRQIDEIWVMGFPHAGLYESVMAGSGAFWCNAPPLLPTASCERRFVVMGFSYERELGEMLHSYNHRAEAILARVFNSQGFLAWAYKPERMPETIRPDQKLNLFERFILFDALAPGQAGVGTVHHAPNALRDYDLGNPRLVFSGCYDWLQFPEFKGDRRMVSTAEWGGGTERAYQRWWMNHLPKVAGRRNGIHNNWWQYIANLDNVTP